MLAYLKKSLRTVSSFTLGSQSSFKPPCFSSQDKQSFSTHILIRPEMFAA